jgi:hypothetical protein
MLFRMPGRESSTRTTLALNDDRQALAKSGDPDAHRRINRAVSITLQWR